MLVPYHDSASTSHEDIMETVTEVEYMKLTAFDRMRVRPLGGMSELFAGEKCSIVIDDFLFLGNMNSAGDRKLLEKYQISKYFFPRNDHRSSPYLEHILNVCDFDASDTIRENFNVIHISMSDDDNTNIKQVLTR